MPCDAGTISPMNSTALPSTPRAAVSAPPPPLYRPLHLPAEPFVFAALMVVLMVGLARTLPAHHETAPDLSSHPITVAPTPAA